MTISFLNESKLEYIDFIISNLKEYCKIKSIDDFKFSNEPSKDINIYVIWKKQDNVIEKIIAYSKENKVKIDGILIAKFDGKKINNISALSATKKCFDKVFTISRTEIKSKDSMLKKPFSSFSIDMEKMLRKLIQK